MNKPTTLAGRLLTIDACGMGAVLALGAGAYFFGAAPIINARAEIDGRRQGLEEQARNAAGQESLIVGEQMKLADLGKQLAEMQIELFPPTDINKRLRRITEICAAAQLTVQQLDPGQPRPGGGGDLGKFSIVPIRLAGVGAFDGIAGFMHQLLDREFPDVEVRSLNLTAPADGQTEAAFAVDLRWYAAPADYAGAETGK